jgi:hypothetical protein
MDCKKLKDELLSATLESTELMKELAALKAHQLKIGAMITDSTFSERKKSKSTHSETALQKSKLLEQSSRQEKEIMQMKQEIQALSAKCGSAQFCIQSRSK